MYILFLMVLSSTIFILIVPEQLLESKSTEASSIFDDLQSCLSTQQSEMALFTRELRQVRVWTFIPFSFKRNSIIVN